MGFADCQASGRGLQWVWQGFALRLGKSKTTPCPKFTVNFGQGVVLFARVVLTTLRRYPCG